MDSIESRGHSICSCLENKAKATFKSLIKQHYTVQFRMEKGHVVYWCLFLFSLVSICNCKKQFRVQCCEARAVAKVPVPILCHFTRQGGDELLQPLPKFVPPAFSWPDGVQLVLMIRWLALQNQRQAQGFLSVLTNTCTLWVASGLY